MAGKKNKQPVTNPKPAGIKKEHPVPVKETIVVSDENVLDLKEETLKWLSAIIGALLVYFIIASIIQSSYHPDIPSLIKAANEMSFTGDSRPEPMESLLFRTGILSISLGIVVFYFLLSKIKAIKGLAKTPFFTFFTAICVVVAIGVIYYSFAADNPFAAGGPEQPQNSRDLVGKSNFSFFFEGIFLGGHLLLYTFFIVPLIAVGFYFGLIKYKLESNSLFNKALTITSIIVLGGTVLAIILINTCEFPYTFENKYDFNAVYYSVTQVFAGVPMLVDGFTNTYGLYPQFLNLIFQVIGLSVFKFSLVMSLLIGGVFFLNFLFLRKVIDNKVVWFLGCCSLLIFPYLGPRILTPFDSAFSFYPIRYLIPSTLICMAVFYLKSRSQLIYWSTSVIMGFFIIWNPEIGMVCYMSWLAFNTYTDFYSAEGKINIKKILLHWVGGAACIAVAFILFKILFYATYGVSANIELLFGYILHLGKGGLGLLPMVLVHPWNISALIIILGLTYAITKWLKKEVTAKSSLVLLISIISIGFLIYFQGRSHNWSFAVSTNFAFVLLAMLGDELWSKIKDKGQSVWPLHLLFVVFLFLISFSFFELLYSHKKIIELVSQDDAKDNQMAEENQISSNTDFILNHSHEKEKIYIFTAMQYQDLYFDGNKRKSAFNPGQQDMVLNTDLAKLEKRIADSSYALFIEPSLAHYPLFIRPLAAMSATYDVKDVHQTMFLLNKRKMKLPAKAYFGQADDMVIHEKYADDTAGIKLRINDALGIKPVALNPAFSVEVLFYSGKQLYPYATLAGNMNDSSGFIIANIINTPNYFFGINGKGSALPLPNNEWVYCVMNVYPDHMEVYQDGNLAGAFPIASSIRQSPVPVTIGNLGYMRYFVGGISEVAIHNKVLDKTQVQATWDAIKAGK